MVTEGGADSGGVAQGVGQALGPTQGWLRRWMETEGTDRWRPSVSLMNMEEERPLDTPEGRG